MKTSHGRLVTLAVAIAEEVLGKRLPQGAVVHHLDGDFTNDSNTNLAVFPSKAYHNLIHARMDALAVCGHANWAKCQYCKRYDAPENLFITMRNGRRAWHRKCNNAYSLDGYYRRKNGSANR